jgi:hypothetical protein
MSRESRRITAWSRLALASILAATVGAVVLVGPGRALASHVDCGDTITADTTLDSDLLDCPNDGIIIGADDVTLDLNGHMIDGDGTPFAGCTQGEICDGGVVDDGHDGVTVRHGSVREFSVGVAAFGARHTRVLGISSSTNRFAGILFFKCARSVVRNSSGNGSTHREGEGLFVLNSRQIRVLNSSFRRNAHVGIKPIGSTNSLIKGNVLAHNGDEALLMEGGEGFEIRHNRLVRNGAGITLGPGSHNVIKRNYVSRGRDGIRIEKGHGNLVAHNVVVGAHRAGIRLGITHPFLGGAHNTVRRNLVRDSHLDGFLINAKDDHSVLKHNIAKRAGDDGFDVESRSAKLTSNRAVRNGDLGINAVRGVGDGGGNVARHNGDPRQCTNIACS